MPDKNRSATLLSCSHARQLPHRQGRSCNPSRGLEAFTSNPMRTYDQSDSAMNPPVYLHTRRLDGLTVDSALRCDYQIRFTISIGATVE
eukprot:6487227-Amphidinium_carterae.1